MMNTDLDTTLTTALRDAATTTTVSDDALASIMHRADRRSRPSRSPRRFVLTGVTIIAVGAGVGTTYAIVADRLNPDQAKLVEESTCDISSANARLVASAPGLGRSVEYWTVDGADSHGDLLFEHGAAFGGGGCGPMSRAVVHPHLPWANYTLTADPREGNGLGHFTFFGQAPAGAVTVDIVTSAGTIHVDVTSPDGYFVALAELPVPGLSLPPAPPPSLADLLRRVDAYAANGTLLGTGSRS
jgi:hypothetical protein